MASNFKETVEKLLKAEIKKYLGKLASASRVGFVQQHKI